MKTVRARRLREHQTNAEARLWNHLRNRQLDGLKFRRQAPFDHYIVDFICYEAKLIIELDGSQHSQSHIQKQDQTRTRYLEKCGYQVLRFWNTDILTNVEGVLAVIYKVARESLSPARERDETS